MKAALAIGLACLTVPAIVIAEEASVLSLARTVGQQLAEGQLQAIHAKMSADAQQRLPLAQFESVWKSLIGQYGELQGTGKPRLANATDIATALLPLKFKNGDFELRISAPKGTIEVFLLMPSKDASGEAWQPPSYAQPETVREVEVEIGPPGKGLPGTLTLPARAGPHPAVVLVHGSGPSDRDASLGPNKPFRDLAFGLASRGIAVLRYDKRTRVYPDDFLSRPFTVHEEVLADAALAVEMLAAHADIAPDRIFLLGHSLGGTVAPRVAQLTPRIAGLIIAAGATRPLPLLLQEQTAYLARLRGSGDESAISAQRALAQDVKKALEARPGSDPTPLLGATVSYWGDLNAYDPAKAAAAYKGRLLVVQGARDYQVTLADLARYQQELAGRTDVTIKVYPDLNHLLMTGKGPSDPREYAMRSHVARDVVEDIAAFVKSP